MIERNKKDVIYSMQEILLKVIEYNKNEQFSPDIYIWGNYALLYNDAFASSKCIFCNVLYLKHDMYKCKCKYCNTFMTSLFHPTQIEWRYKNILWKCYSSNEKEYRIETYSLKETGKYYNFDKLLKNKYIKYSEAQRLLLLK